MNSMHVGTSWCWLTCRTIKAGLRPSEKVENPNRSTGWKSMRLRKLAQASRNSVTLQTSQQAKAPLNKHSKLFQSPCHCAFPSGALGDIAQLLAYELWEAGGEIKGSNRHAQLLQLCLTPCDPVDCSPPSLLCPWDFSGKDTGVGCHFVLQGMFLAQGLSPALQVDSLLTEPPEKPRGGKCLVKKSNLWLYLNSSPLRQSVDALCMYCLPMEEEVRGGSEHL